MKQLLIALALLTAAFFIAIANAPTSPPPGLPAVYAQINSETDCSVLQDHADTAWENNRLQSKGGWVKDAENRPYIEITSSYMEAAYDRMREVGCY